ncbi:hypothetical protein JCM8097_006852 [Rhodosporidiobolus ruineniae]
MAFPSESTSSRLTTTSRRDSALTANPVLERTRRTSLPADLVQSRHQSFVGSSGSSTLRIKDRGDYRLSVASFTSIESVAEEEDEASDGRQSSNPAAQPASRRSRTSSRRTASPPASRPPSMVRPPNLSRYSLPNAAYHGGFQSFSAALPAKSSGPKPLSPLMGKFPDGGAMDGEAAPTEEEREKRAERRMRIAEELRDTEKAYVQVLEEIDALYYQPLIAALPTTDPLSRRSSSRYSTAGPPASRSTSPNVSPRHSIYSTPSAFASSRTRTSTRESVDSLNSTPSTAPSTPPTPTSGSSGSVLGRREINEVFSNFTDVLNLSHVMLLAVDEAVPARPSEPLPVLLSPRASSSALVASPETFGKPASAPAVAGAAEGSSLESQPGGLSTSAETTASSAGPATPEDDGSPGRPAPRARTTSVRSSRRSRAAAAAPPVRLGKALLPILPFLKQYSLFVANFSGSLGRLSSLEAPLDAPSNPVAATGAPGSTSEDRDRWQAFASQAQKRRIEVVGPGSGKIGLGGLLLNVVQRVPRYRLLLKDLIRCTEEDHPDLRDLETAFSIVDGVASHLDSQIHSHTNDLQILDLQRAFTNLDAPLLSPGRRLLKTGLLRKLNRSGKEQDRTFLLFNDILLHASGGEAGWSAVGLGIANAVLGAEEGAQAAAPVQLQYRLHRRFELEDVTVVGNDEVTESGLKYGFEILSTEKSFAVYAASLEDKNAWLDAIRDAKAALMSDRHTLQRIANVEPVSAPPAPPATVTSPRLVKRISLPVPPSPSSSSSRRGAAGRSVAFSALPSRLASLPPQLGQVPPTPADEISQPILDFPSTGDEEPPPFVDSPIGDDALSIRSSTSISAGTSPVPVRPRTLSRPRRWSEMHPSAAVQALASALSAVPSAEELANPVVEYPVIEAYNAPVWVPDSRYSTCKCCQASFGVWRRRHHCRLCGSLVCYACSAKYFIIPASLLTKSTSTDPSQADRLARACDPCYAAVFNPSAPSSHFLSSHPSIDSQILRQPSTRFRSQQQHSGDPSSSGPKPPSPSSQYEHRLSRILGPQAPDAPLFEFDISSYGFEEAAPPSAPAPPVAASTIQPSATVSKTGAEAGTQILPSQTRRVRKVSAVNELRKALGR